MPYKLRYSLVVWLVAIGLFSFLFLPPILVKFAWGVVEQQTSMLYVDLFDSTDSDWIKTGNSPYLHASITDYIASQNYDSPYQDFMSYFWFANVSESILWDNITDIYIVLEMYRNYGSDASILIKMRHSTGALFTIDTLTINTDSYIWYEAEVKSKMLSESIAGLNSLNMRLVDESGARSIEQYVFCRQAYLRVTYLVEYQKPLPEVPLDAYIKIGYGLGSLGVLAFLPLFLIMMYRRKKEKFWSWIPWAICLFFIAIGCLVGWLYE